MSLKQQKFWQKDERIEEDKIVEKNIEHQGRQYKH